LRDFTNRLRQRIKAWWERRKVNAQLAGLESPRLRKRLRSALAVGKRGDQRAFPVFADALRTGKWLGPDHVAVMLALNEAET
jgi:HEAT repeat protein